MAADDADALFAQIVSRYADDPAVTAPDGRARFDGSALKAGDKIFAMLHGGELVVKLPR